MKKHLCISGLNVTTYDSFTSYPELTVEVRVAFPSRKIIQRTDNAKLRRKLLEAIAESVELAE